MFLYQNRDMNRPSAYCTLMYCFLVSVLTSPNFITVSFTVYSQARNTGNYHYYGVVSNITINDEQGKPAGTVKTKPFSRAIVPGQQVKITASVPQGLPEAMYQLTSRIEMEDGTLLATETKSLQVGNPPSAAGSSGAAGAAPNAGGARSMNIPGPGGLAVCIAASLGILGGIWTTRKRKR